MVVVYYIKRKFEYCPLDKSLQMTLTWLANNSDKNRKKREEADGLQGSCRVLNQIDLNRRLTEQFTYWYWKWNLYLARSEAVTSLWALRSLMIHMRLILRRGSSSGIAVKNLPANAGVMGLIPGSGRSPEEGHGNSLQYSRLENPMDRGAWRATVHGVTKSWIRLSN